MADAGTGEWPGFQGRACDACRARKVKCDKQVPCSNCKTHKVGCHTSPVKRTKERKSRVLISTQYEEKIDRIANTLSGVENSLRSFATALSDHKRSLPLNNTTTNQPSASVHLPHYSASTYDDTDSPITAFEGESSLTAHSIYASEYISAAAKSDLTFPRTNGMDSALQALKGLVSGQNEANTTLSEARFQNCQLLPRFSPTSLTLPPLEAVMSVLRTSKDKFSPFFTTCYPFLDMEKLHDLLKSAYLNLDGYSIAKAIQIHGGLYWLFREASVSGYSDQDGNPSDVRNYEALCKRNLETCLNSLDLLLPATDENVIALFIGALHAIESSKPTLCRSLTCAAVLLAKSLGYHYASSIRDPGERRQKSWLFWSIYILDKSLSLRFGTASSIQDYDLSLPLPEGDGDRAPNSLFWAEITTIWVRTARLQGQIFESLYSPSALSSAHEDRVSKAITLAREMDSIRQSLQQIDITVLESGGEREYARMIQLWDEVTHLCNLTLIYRSMPSDSHSSGIVNVKCVEYAREAISAHQRCFAELKENHPESWEGYLRWAVIHVPFCPFIVLFCSVITSSDRQDFERLRAFLATLQTSTSLAVNNFRRLCQLFFQVAELYLEERSSNKFGSPSHDKDVEDAPRSQFDQYLDDLGFGVTVDGVENGNSEAGWFQGNQYVFGLLEQDLSYLDELNT